jgi:hypothetical protein
MMLLGTLERRHQMRIWDQLCCMYAISRWSGVMIRVGSEMLCLHERWLDLAAATLTKHE